MNKSIIEGTRKVQGFRWASILGIVAFFILAFRMETGDLPTLCEFWFIYQGIITSGFFGGNFGEHWAKSRAFLSNPLTPTQSELKA